MSRVIKVLLNSGHIKEGLAIREQMTDIISIGLILSEQFLK